MRTFTQLVGTTAANSSTLYPMSFTSLANNNSPQNVALGASLVNNEHRYLLQKYFDNEKSVTTTTVGAMNLVATAPISLGATTATLTASWAFPTCIQLVNFSDGEQRSVLFTLGSTAITWQGGLTANVTTALNAVGVSAYALPANISKLKDFTVNVGQQKFLPNEVQTRREWDLINFLPYNSDIPQWFFMYNGFVNIFPVPSTSGYVITFNYKTRVPDLNFTDYSTGNITTATVGSISITGTATSWSTTGKYPIGVDISEYNLALRIDPPFGDGIWYPILQFNSETSLTLSLPIINAPNITASSTYTIGQLLLLSEDFQDMPVYGSLMNYYTYIQKDEGKFKMAESQYKSKLEMLADYAGTKTALSIDLSIGQGQQNANLFIYANNSQANP